MKWTSAIGVVTDLTCVIGVFIAYLLLELYRPSLKLGFFCDDDKLLNSYNGYPSGLEIAIAQMYLLIVTVVSVTEVILYFANKSPLKQFNELFSILFQTYMLAAFGMGGGLFICMVIVSCVPKLKPDFFDACSVQRSDYCFKPGQLKDEYITDYDCKTQARLDVVTSFPCFVAMGSAYSTVYVLYYLFWRVNQDDVVFFKHMVQTLVVCYCLYVSSDLVQSHRFDWYDVIGGWLIGIFTSAVMIRSMLERNERQEKYNMTFETVLLTKAVSKKSVRSTGSRKSSIRRSISATK